MLLSAIHVSGNLAGVRIVTSIDIGPLSFLQRPDASVDYRARRQNKKSNGLCRKQVSFCKEQGSEC
jgi:hypothetical protein